MNADDLRKLNIGVQAAAATMQEVGTFGMQPLSEVGFDKTQVSPQDIMIVENEITIEYTYPLKRPTTRTHIGVWTRAALCERVQRDYAEIYAEEEATMHGKPSCIRGMYNRAQSDGKYGIWGHFIGDLVLTTLYKKGKVYAVGVDS
jgi:hypothetical protein